jgi:uncharacterized repeat protein (TIGR03847 family)
MPYFEIDLDLDHITADAIGQPGQRVFYLQGRQGSRTITLILEKFQLQSLAIGIEQFLAELAIQNPNLPEASSDYQENDMRLQLPLEPLFRIGEIGLGYDPSRDRVVMIVREIQEAEQDPEKAATVRFWGTRSQFRALGRWSIEVINRGRPICPQCGQPMEPEGHFCPKKNGHKH